MAVPKDIDDLRNHFYNRVGILWWATWWIAAGTQGIALITIWITATTGLAFLAIVILAAPIVIAWLREKANEAARRADKCRRVILYADGLGRSITKEELAEIRAWGMGAAPTGATFVPPYYSSTKSMGPNRLADIVAESSFFTSQLAERMLKKMWAIFIVSLGVLAAVLSLSDLFTPADSASLAGSIDKLSKAVASIIVFLISGDFLLLIKKYKDLQSLAYYTFHRAAKLRDQDSLPESQILALVEDYNIGVSQAPPIPARLYERYKDELNKVYRESHKAEAAI